MRPVQIVFAGKAHPADAEGKRLLQEVSQHARDPRFRGRVAFVEDYDLDLAAYLVAGVDVWLNTPRAPLEASGTSGMKAAVNGVPNLSIQRWLVARSVAIRQQQRLGNRAFLALRRRR